MWKKRLSLVSVLVGVVLACSLPGAGGEDPGLDATLAPPPVQTASPLPETTALPPPSPTAQTPLPPEADRIGVRVVAGEAEFYNTVSGERFVPRGVNYVRFFPNDDGFFTDSVMSTKDYDPEEVRRAFQHLANFEYNTVRIFFDTCVSPIYCLTNPNGPGLNPGYLDNMADLMRIAAEEGIYIIFTANAIPDGGGYWPFFDSIFFDGEHAGFTDARNADYLHAAGVETKRKIWVDLLTGLQARAAPFSAVLGWSLTNELWLWGEAPPFTLESGLVTIANGETYDMSDPSEKARMAAEGTEYFIRELAGEIKAIDPLALTTIGFFPPAVDPMRYIMTPAFIDTAPVDFWDFHAYYDGGISLETTAESYGMVGYSAKPIVMGETAAGYENVPSAASALINGAGWIADSCRYGFDGWLYWGYYAWPEAVNGKPWAMLEDDGLIFEWLSPALNPDPCDFKDLPVANLAKTAALTASRSDPSHPPSGVVDGTTGVWNAGDFPPQWLEIAWEAPSRVDRVAMVVSQWPASITRHQVTARLSDGSAVLLGEFNRFTSSQKILAIDLPAPLLDVVSIRITTTQSRSYAAWHEIEVLSWQGQEADPPAAACLGQAVGSVVLRSAPDPDSPGTPALSAGARIYLDGFFTDAAGSRWARTGGETWLPATGLNLESGCRPEEQVVTPGPRLVPVTFEVAVPPGTPGEVFMAGTFGGVEFERWIPYMFVLQETGSAVWTLEMLLPAGAEIQYVYTRSSWETIERPLLTCDRTDPRTFIVEDGPGMRIEDTIVRWRDLDC